MKKYLILLIIPLLFFSVGCDKDEVNDPDYSELILGHWELNSYRDETTSVTTFVDPIVGTETITNTVSSNTVFYAPFINYPHDELFCLEYYTFKYDNTFTILWHCYQDNDLLNYIAFSTVEGTYVIQGGAETNNLGQQISTTHTLSTQVNSEDFLTFEIQELSESAMMLIREYSSTSDLPDNEHAINSTIQTRSYSKISEIPSP